jgi:hypothetical protein
MRWYCHIASVVPRSGTSSTERRESSGENIYQLSLCRCRLKGRIHFLWHLVLPCTTTKVAKTTSATNDDEEFVPEPPVSTREANLARAFLHSTNQKFNFNY